FCGECTSTPDEVCDGKDNDCDGKTDESPDIGQGEPCENQKGVCQGSRKRCKAGKWVCNAATLEDWKWQYETTETACDDLDNDCDGLTDEPAECCEPQCAGKDCGPDGCGGQCGSCGDGFCMASDCVDKGYEAWSFLVEGYTITSTPAVAADGTVFVTTDFPFQLVAIKPDGSKKWSVTAPQNESFGHHVAGPNGVVVVRTTNGVAGYGTASGDLRWVSGYALDDFVLWSDGGIVGTMKGGADEYKLVALDGNGPERWTVQLGSAADMWFWSHPVIGSDGTVYVGAPDNRLHAVTAKGKEKWTSKELGALDDGAAAIAADGTIYVGTGDIMDEGGGPLYALAPANGSVKWTYDTGEGVAAWPVVGPDGTIVVAVPGGVQAVTPAGKKKWACDVGDNVYEAPAVTRHGIVLVGAYGKVVAVDPDGKVMWEFQTGVDSPLVLDSDGYLYVNYSTGSGSHLRVLDVSSGAGSPWPMWAHDARLAGHFTGADGAAPW
ncbi:MAG: PQQ-like beta-propeller repeat protein, partial [Deltaproteobacteria bacterium]|nr:PQQ-like beta-propeller repeat protein [Deltaproteobacteria bacterium]